MSQPGRVQTGFAVNPIWYDNDGNILIACGTTAPANAAAGYAKGCIFIDTDSAALYRNAGTAASADFDPLALGAVQSAALTAAKAAFTIADAEGTPDNAIAAVTSTTPFGFSNAAELITLLYKVQNLHVRVGEIEAALEAAGIVAAN